MPEIRLPVRQFTRADKFFICVCVSNLPVRQFTQDKDKSKNNEFSKLPIRQFTALLAVA